MWAMITSLLPLVLKLINLIIDKSEASSEAKIQMQKDFYEYIEKTSSRLNENSKIKESLNKHKQLLHDKYFNNRQ